MIMKNILAIILFTFHSLTFSVLAQTLHPLGSSKRIALTFDACMTGSMVKKLEAGTEKSLYNAAIIEYLRLEKIPATIFISGLWAEKYPDVVKAIAADPLFEIGNHSYHHRGFTEDCFGLSVLPENEKEADIQMAQVVLIQLTGKKPKLFRFPGGCYHEADQALVNHLELKVVGWTFASGDAFNSDTNAIIENVLTKAKSGAIVVFHLMGGRYAPKTAEVIKIIIPALRQKGYDFVTVSNLLNYN